MTIYGKNTFNNSGHEIMVDDGTVCDLHTARAVLQIERTHPRLDENTLSERVHIEKGGIGQHQYRRITTETQPKHRITVKCD